MGDLGTISQSFEGAYVNRRPKLKQYLLEKHISLPLELGDGMFFNPALFNAAGENVTLDFEPCADQ